MRLVTSLVVGMCLCGWSVWATEIYVSSQSQSQFQSIQDALDQAEPGDTVFVPGGTYLENLTMKSGVTLKSLSGPQNTIIDGNGGIGLYCEQCQSGTRVSGFTFSHGGSYSGCGILAFDNSTVEIDHNIFRDNQADFEAAGVLIQRFSTGLIHDNLFQDNTAYKAAALSVIVNSEADIQRNVFKGNTSTNFAAAIGINDSDVFIAHNVFVDNSSGGVGGTVDVTTSHANISNNTFLRNQSDQGGSCISLNSYDHTVTVTNNMAAYNPGFTVVDFRDCQDIGCNIFWESGQGYSGPCTSYLDSNMKVDPLLCDPYGNRGQIAAESPCFSAECGFIGANPHAGCSMPTDKESTRKVKSWGDLKASFR